MGETEHAEESPVLNMMVRTMAKREYMQIEKFRDPCTET